MTDVRKILNDAEASWNQTALPQATDVKLFSKTKETKKFLAELKEHVQLAEQLKYPNPPYACKNLAIEVEGKPASVMYVKYNGEPPDEAQLVAMENASLLTRKLSLLAGAVMAIANYDVEDSQKTAFLLAIRNEADKAVSVFKQPPQKMALSSSMNSFVDDLAGSFSTLGIAKDEAIGRMRNAEKFFVADLNANRYIINESTLPGKNQQVIQMDVPFNNKLTDIQRKEFKKLKDNEANSWFSHMPKWEKKAFLGASNENNFSNIFQSSAMQNAPGVKNARTNYLIEKKGDNFNILSRSVKTATQVPYEAPERFRDELTQMNTEQIIGQVKTENNFQSWGKFLVNNHGMKPLIFFHSLLSNTKLGGDDNMLVATQSKAIASAAEKYSSEFHILQGNDPVNILRNFVGNGSSVSAMVGRKERWDHVHELQSYAKTFLSKVNPFALTNDSKELQEYKLIKEASAALTALPEMEESLGKNRAAFKSAYIGLMVEGMGGTVISNCKSGKDRTGLDELYRNSMRIYFQEHHKLPKFNDTGQNRENFIQIFCTLFNSMKAQEAAAANTPGSFGIKDTAKMLESDIVAALGNSYKYSNERSGMNKPKELTADEANTKSILKKSDESFKKKLSSDEMIKKSENIKDSDLYTSENVAIKINGITQKTISSLNVLVDEITAQLSNSYRNFENTQPDSMAANQKLIQEMKNDAPQILILLRMQSKILSEIGANVVTREKLKATMAASAKGDSAKNPSGKDKATKKALYAEKIASIEKELMKSVDMINRVIVKAATYLGTQNQDKYKAIYKPPSDSEKETIKRYIQNRNNYNQIVHQAPALEEKHAPVIDRKPSVSMGNSASILSRLSSQSKSNLSLLSLDDFGESDNAISHAVKIHPEPPPPLLSEFIKLQHSQIPLSSRIGVK